MKVPSAILVLCVVASSPIAGQDAAEEIRSLRAQSNAAIARHDVAGVLSLYDAEYQVTAGGGRNIDGADQPEVWAAEFARAADLLYVRTAESIEVSSSGSRAAEIGVWSGSWTTADGPQSTGGRYAAHWVLLGGEWKLRAELFVTLR